MQQILLDNSVSIIFVTYIMFYVLRFCYEFFTYKEYYSGEQLMNRYLYLEKIKKANSLKRLAPM